MQGFGLVLFLILITCIPISEHAWFIEGAQENWRSRSVRYLPWCVCEESVHSLIQYICVAHCMCTPGVPVSESDSVSTLTRRKSAA